MVKAIRLAAEAVLLAVLSSVVMASAAWAHGGAGATEGYVIIQQALSYLVNDPNANMTADAAMTSEAMMKIDEALANEDQDGVAVPKVKQAKAALEAGNSDQARTLLQASIAGAVAELKPATAEETGTSVMLAPLSHPALTGRDWTFLALSVLLAVVGTALGFLFRPRLKLSDLRQASSNRPAL